MITVYNLKEGRIAALFSIVNENHGIVALRAGIII